MTQPTTLPPITQAGAEMNLKLLVYGNSGVGKTRLLASAQQDPRTAPILILDFEGGTTSIAGSSCDVMRITSIEQFEATLNWIRTGEHKYKSIGVDSFSEIHQQVMIEVMAQRVKGMANAKPSAKDQPEQQDYLKALIRMRRYARAFRDLPLHIFMTALAKEEVDPREGRITKPYFPGAFAEEVGGIMDVMGCLQAREGADGKTERALLVAPIDGFRAKFRTPMGNTVPTRIKEPTAGKLLDYKEGKGVQ